MRRANQLIGAPVFTATTSEQVGTIKDIAYAPTRDQVVGFLVDDADHDALPFAAVETISADTVLIPNRDVLVDHDDDPAIEQATESSIKINGLTVVDRDGNELGKVEDTFFDERSGRIAGFQIAPKSGGPLGIFGGDQDQETKYFLPAERILDWDDDRMRVRYAGTATDLDQEKFPESFGAYRGGRAA